MATGFSAVRSGIVIFAIPFVFAMYPELLLIEEAVLDPAATGAELAYLPGYDGAVDWAALGWLCARLLAALYLLASGLARFDRRGAGALGMVAAPRSRGPHHVGDPLVHGPRARTGRRALGISCLPAPATASGT